MTKHSKLYAIRREDNGKTLPVLQDKNLKQVYDPSGNVLKKRVILKKWDDITGLRIHLLAASSIYDFNILENEYLI